MRKYLILLSSIVTVSSTSTMAVACGAAPSGQKIDISWIDKNGQSPTNEKTDVDNNLASNIMLPTFNMINSTDQSRSQSTKPNDGMTKDQIDNSLWDRHNNKSADSLTGGKWDDFFKLWLSNKDYSYTKIDFNTGDTYNQGKAPSIKNYNLSKKAEDANSIYTSATVESSVKYLDQYYANADVFNSDKTLVFANLQNDGSQWGYDGLSAKLKFTFGKDGNKYSFEADIKHLVAELGLVKKDDGKYGWYLIGYSFVSEQDYPTTNFSEVTSNPPFKFILAPHKDPSLSQYANPYLDYVVDKSSIQ